jgi:uncharacterized protein with GYD domain
MPKYLWQAFYTPQGAQGLRNEGGTARRAAVQSFIEKAGGKLETFYYAFGETDAFLIADLPDATTAAAVSLAVNATGAVTLRTTPLMTCEELDAAAKRAVDYRPPGGTAR